MTIGAFRREVIGTASFSAPSKPGPVPPPTVAPEAGGGRGGAWDDVGKDSELGVSYDLLTSLSERMGDLNMFEETQIGEEALTVS